MRTPRRAVSFALLAAVGASSACSDDASYLIVTVNGRPAVHDAASLKVTLSNTGTMRTDELPLGNKPFPVTFSISAPGRSGDLGIQVDAIDSNGLVVGRGETTSTVEMATANVMIETADFVINSDYAEDQFPSNDFEAHGFQVAAAADGNTWTAAYRERCAAPCNMYARRFDKTGRPVRTQLAAGTNGFPLSTQLTTSFSTPAIATAGTTTVEVWDFRDPASTAAGIACRSIDAAGTGIPSQTTVATDASTDVVSIVPLSNGNFAVAWSAFLTTGVIRAAIVKPDCSVLSGPITVSTTANPREAAVASTIGIPGRVIYAFVIDGSVHVRLGDNTNKLPAPDIKFLPATTTEIVQSVRVAPLGTGFAIVVRWVLATGSTGPGRLELYRTTNTGAVIGSSILVSTKSGTDFGSSEAFGVATRSDGVLMVVWHSCMTNGDGSGCGVWGRAFRDNGTPVGPEFVIPTTTTGDQTNPSVAALADSFAVLWKDDSGSAPDMSGSAVRGRIIYPN